MHSVSSDTENWNVSFSSYMLSKLLFFIFSNRVTGFLRVAPHKKPVFNSGPQEINDDGQSIMNFGFRHCIGPILCQIRQISLTMRTLVHLSSQKHQNQLEKGHNPEQGNQSMHVKFLLNSVFKQSYKRFFPSVELQGRAKPKGSHEANQKNRGATKNLNNFESLLLEIREDQIWHLKWRTNTVLWLG